MIKSELNKLKKKKKQWRNFREASMDGAEWQAKFEEVRGQDWEGLQKMT